MSTMPLLPKVLLVEDDQSIANALSQALATTYDVDLAITGQSAQLKTQSIDYDTILLDLHLPDTSGEKLCQLIRQNGIRTPILVVSGDNNVLTKIKLLDSGANDYLTKPFSIGELKARLRVIARDKNQRILNNKQLEILGIILNKQSHQVSREGIIINLRRKEFSLLECLMENAGTVVTRHALARYAWQESQELWTNSIDVHIKHLRDKIDRPFSSPLIKTVHGLGYKIAIKQPAITDKVYLK
ncbi:MAG: response regulator transcription factor [Candidatus Saccharimonadales bacterium]